MDDKLQRELKQLRARHRYRQRRILQSPQTPQLTIDNRPQLSFCSNDYLGLANHPEVIAALQEGAQRWGVGSGASHLVSGHSEVHHALEEELAAFVARPRALLFSTGYMANMGVIAAIADRHTRVWEDRLNHASLLDGAALSSAQLQRYPHGDANHLAERLAADDAKRHLIVTDGVFSMDGDLAPLPALSRVATHHNAPLMVDDAHGLGVIGEHGGGVVEHFGLGVAQAPILVGTLGKAFGTFGAFVAGDETLIDYLIQKARTYIYTTALPPAVAHATRASLRIVQRDAWRRDHLHTLIQQFRHGAAQIGLTLTPSTTPIQPLLLGNAAQALAVSQALSEQGIFVTAIRPPTVPEGTARLRITFSAAHREDDVERLLTALEKVT